MKTLKIAILALCATFMLAACGGSGNPEAVAENLYKAYFDGDFEKAAKYATRESAIMLQQIAANMPAEKLKDFKEKFKGATAKALSSDINEEEGMGVVSVELTGPDGKTNTVKCDVVKEDGSWKAGFTK